MSETINIDKVVIYGSGYWARNIIETLNDIMVDGAKLTVFTRHNVDDFNAWLLKKNFGISVLVKDGRAVAGELAGRPVIIANSARDHAEIGVFSLSEHSPVLIEKPMALNGQDANMLLASADKNSGMLASAFVFLFAPYMLKLRDQLNSVLPPKSIHISWIDPQYIPKRYDSSVPIYKDVLPHLTSLLNLLYPNLILEFKSVDVKRGGALVVLDFSTDDTSIELIMERDGVSRTRLIEVTTQDGKLISLDFTNEPPKFDGLTVQHQPDSSDLYQERPLALLLRAFLQWVDGGEKDTRLNPLIAAKSCNLMDIIAPSYSSSQKQWLRQSNANHKHIFSSDVTYARTEISQKNGRLSPENITTALKDR